MFTKEDYVSPGTALLLKERGFDEPVLTQYSKTGTIWTCSEPENFNDSKDCFSRPTLYEAQKWLRNKHNIHLCVKCTAYIKRYEGHDYICEILDLLHHHHEDTLIYNSYEQALDAGIQEALKLI